MPGDVIHGTFPDQASAAADALKWCPPPPPPPAPGNCVDPGIPQVTPPMFRNDAECAAYDAQADAGIATMLWDWVSKYSWDTTDPMACFPQWIIDIIGTRHNTAGRITGIALNVVDIGKRILEGILKGDGQCTSPNEIPVAIVGMILGAAERWFGAGMRKPLYRVARWEDYLCPDMIPNQTETDALKIRDRISQALWECWTKANNNVPETRFDILQAGAARPNISEIVQLFNRGFYDQSESAQRLRWEGVSTNGDHQAFRELAKYIPGPSDLVQFMKRDVFDLNVVAEYKLDDDFNAKFSGVAPAWAKAQGMDVDTFRYYWRAHWQLPGSGQGYEMYHRLRPGRVAPTDEFTVDDLRKLLGINDVAPAFVDRLIAISRPLPRLIDSRNSYNVGVISRETAVEINQDRGLSVDDANTVVDYWTIKRRDYIRGLKWYRRWIVGSITDKQAKKQSLEYGIDDAHFDQLSQDVDAERAQNTVEVCTKAVHKRYMIGDVSVPDAIAILQGIGHDTGSSVALTKAWACELSSRGKAIGAAELCQYVEQGLISVPDYKRRLLALGYSPDDADRVASICAGKIAAKLAALQAKLAAAQKKAADKQDALSRKQVGAAAKVAAAEKKRKERIERDAEKAWLTVTKSAGIIAKLSGELMPDVIKILGGYFNELVKVHGYSDVGAGAMVHEIAAEAKTQKEKDWKAYYKKVMAALPPADIPDYLHGPELV